MSLTLLVVDDDAVDRQSVRRTLQKAGVDASVVEAASADAAFDALVGGGIDCVLLDFHLPGADGLAVLQRLRGEGVDVPVVVLTGQGDEQTAVDLMKAGAADYLSKHVLTPDRLERSLRHALTMAAAERERRGLLAREQAARQEAQVANRLKDEFLATLSHELRTPLNSVLGWTRLLIEGQLDPATVRRGLETIERNVRLQVKLIDDLLDLSRIVTGKLTVDRQPVSLASLVSTAVESHRPTATAAGLTVRLLITGDEQTVLGDSTRLQQVLANLLSNAIKFTPAGGWVEVRLAFSDLRAKLTVADSGVGIAQQFLPHVFERFRQADASATRRHAGLGLGLAIVKHLVEAHGGTVTVESGGPNQGAAFHVLLPTTDVALSAPPADEMSTPASLGGVRVLVVDDDNDSRELLAALLAGCGADVRVAADAVEALAAVRERIPDVVLSDIAMPGLDGYMLLSKLRAVHPGRKIAAAAITAYASAGDRRRALDAGFEAHIAKPFDPAHLVSTVQKLARIPRDDTAMPA